MSWLLKKIKISSRIRFCKNETVLWWLKPITLFYTFLFPKIWIDDQPLYSLSQLNKLKALINEFDSGEVGGFGFDEKANLQLRKTPFIHCEFQYASSGMKFFKIVKIEDYERPVPNDLEIFLEEMVKTTVDRICKMHHKAKIYFEKRRVCSITFVRYELRSKKKYPHFPWHADLGFYQSITPIAVPKELEGAHLQFLARPQDDTSCNFILDIHHEVNKPIFFINHNYWHRVTPFCLSTAAQEPALRDVFTIEFYEDLNTPLNVDWKEETPYTKLDNY